MATLTIATRTGERNLENEGWIKTADTVERPKEKGAGFFSRVTNMFWRTTCGLSLAGFLLPHEPAPNPWDGLTPLERARLQGYKVMYFGTL